MERWEQPIPDPVPTALDRGENTKGWDRGEDAGEPDDTEEREEHRKGWGGPGRGGGAYPKDVDAALREAIRTLGRRLAVARERSKMPYQKRQEVFKAIDALQEQAEIFLCEAPDYPDKDDGSE